MTRSTGTIATFGLASIFALTVGVNGVWANEPGYGKEGHAEGGHGSMGGHGAGMMHNSTGHLIRHLLKHEKEIGLTAEQVAKLKDMQLNLDKTRIKSEADIQVAERELKALTEDEKSDLGAIEAKLKQSGDLQAGLRMTAIKAKRDVLALLTPEQRTKEKAEHDKVMQQHKGDSKGYGSPHGGAMKSNPHKSGDAAHPAPPASMKVQ
ncbi:MAG: periplasmic heavy metal sensor [Nitrospirota bacterium]|nr:periplasmic heavy metal sensor [Nitrospirota bacterium]MDP2382355.1 periplasmic heavy metal sensor [Nitrospirota bacterium]